MKRNGIWIFILLGAGIIFSLILLQKPVYDKIVAVPFSGYNAPLLSKGPCLTMSKPFSVLLQYLTPQHALSTFAGWLANSETPWLKNMLIRYFLSRFTVNMQEAVIEDPYAYASFNYFFTRHLKPTARPLPLDPHAIVSPADGFVSQIGKIDNETLLQAKGFKFSLMNLLGGSKARAQAFVGGSFATFYLSPKDYHRVHMPLTGKLRETIFIPGQLFSVNQETTAHVPNLFGRNERLVCLFDTEIGPMAVILVGAMLVGSMETVWQANTQGRAITIEAFKGTNELERGGELGYFKMGSTVIVLFGKDKMRWSESLHENSAVQMGSLAGTIIGSA